MRNCPCCGKSIYANGCHVGSSQEGKGKKKQNTEGSGIFTPKAGNRSESGTKQKVSATKYNVDEYASDSDISKSDDDSDNSDDDAEETLPPERASTRKFQPGDKFMIRVKKSDKSGDPGLTFFDFNGGIYIGMIEEGGPFSSTSIDYGDKLVSMNGQKAEMIKSASNAMDLLEMKETVSLYVRRSGRDSVEFKEAIKRLK
jgi:hypothetical protein